MRARSRALLLALAVDALRGPGDGAEPVLADLLTAGLARPEGSVLDPLEGRVDRCQNVLRVLLERVVDLPIERDRRRLRHVIVDRHLLGLVLDRSGVLLLEILDRIEHAAALREELVAKAIGVDRHGQSLDRGSAQPHDPGQAASAVSSSPSVSSIIASAERRSARILPASPLRCSRSAIARCLTRRASACASLRITSASRRA